MDDLRSELPSRERMRDSSLTDTEEGRSFFQQRLKDRKARPAGARALRDALDACECAGRWTEAQAAAWWAEFGAARGAAAGRRAGAPHTLAIDLSVREAVAATVPAGALVTPVT